MHALIRVWTGTGNTARAANVVAETIAYHGWTVDQTVVRFDSSVPTVEELLLADLVVVGCPALGFSAPVHFLRWLKRWPRTPRALAPVAVFASVGGAWGQGGLVPGWSGELWLELAAVLRRRGFCPGHAADFSYPVSWTQVAPPPSFEERNRLVLAADREVEQWASRLAVSWALTPFSQAGTLGRRLVSVVALLFRIVGRRFLGKLFAADPRCNSCGLCVQTCPAGVMRMSGGRPSWSLDCDACNRCINGCPQAAIQVSMARVIVHGLGNLALLVGALWGSRSPVVGFLLYFLGTALEFTVVDPLLSWLERARALSPALTWGWTRLWGRSPAWCDVGKVGDPAPSVEQGTSV